MRTQLSQVGPSRDMRGRQEWSQRRCKMVFSFSPSNWGHPCRPRTWPSFHSLRLLSGCYFSVTDFSCVLPCSLGRGGLGSVVISGRWRTRAWVALAWEWGAEGEYITLNTRTLSGVWVHIPGDCLINEENYRLIWWWDMWSMWSMLFNVINVI